MEDPRHLLPLLLLFLPIIWGVYGFIRKRNEPRLPVRYSSFPIVINSAVLYALAFNLVFFIQELFLALGKKWLGLKAILYHNNHNWFGTHPKESLAQGYGAASIFLAALVFLFIARAIKNSRHWIQLLFLWLSFQGFAQSLPQFITAFMAPDTDTGQAFNYLGISQTTGLIIAIVTIILMLLVCSLFSKYLLQLAPSKIITENARTRFGFIFRIGVLASMIGVIIIVPYRIMPWDRAMAPIFVMVLSVPMVFAHAWKIRPLPVVDNSISKRILISPIILSLLLFAIFQLILSKGVKM